MTRRILALSGTFTLAVAVAAAVHLADDPAPSAPLGGAAQAADAAQAGKPARGPELIRAYFADWHAPYPADLDRGTWGRMHAEIDAMPGEETEVRAGGSVWQPLGPFGMQVPGGGRFTGRILDLALHGGELRAVAAASGGVWEREAAGWQARTESLPTLWTGSVAVHPADPDVMLAGTGEPFLRAGAGLFRTTDGGQTWSHRTLSPEPATCFRVRFAPDGVTAHAACDLGVYRSANGGVTWTRTLSLGAWPTDLAIHPANADTLWTTVYGIGLFRSTDAGLSWAQMPAAGLPASGTGRGAITVCASDPSRMYFAWAQPSGVMLGVFRSTDAGATWSDVSPVEYMWGQGWYNNTIAVSPADPDLVLAGGGGLYRTTDGGGTWTAATDPNLHADYHALAWASGGNVWAGHDGGWSRSTDAGATWDASDNTLPITQYVLIDAAAAADPVVCGGGSQDNGMSLTTDGGASWFFRAGGDGGGLAIDPLDPDRMYCTYGLFSGNSPFHPFRSSDGGVTWDQISAGMGVGGQWWVRIRTDGGSPARAYTYGAQFTFWREEPVSFWFTLNGNPDPLPAWVSDMTVSRRPPGAEWPVIWVCLDTDVSGERLAVWDGGGYVLRDAGLPAGVRVRTVAVHPTRTDVAYALMNGLGTPGQKVFRTTDLGVTWTNVTGNLPDVPLADLVPHPADDDRLYLGAETGCFRTTDGGATWSMWQTGLPSAALVTDLAWVDAPGAFRIVAGTYGRGMWIRDTDAPGATDAPLAAAPASGGPVLHPAAPNPFAEATSLAFTLPRAGHVALRLFDVGGRLVATLVDTDLAAGLHRVRVDAAPLAAGAYFARLETADGVRSRRIVRLR